MSVPHILRHVCNLHNIKETYSVILSALPNKTNLILGYSSPLESRHVKNQVYHLCCSYKSRKENMAVDS